MTQQISISDSAAAGLAQLQALTDYQSAGEMVSAMIARELERYTELKTAVRAGAEQADHGEFSNRTVDQIFDAAMERYLQEQHPHG